MSNAAQVAPPTPPKTSLSSYARRSAGWLARARSSAGLIPAIIIMCVIGAQLSPFFATRANWISILQASAVVGFLVVAESIVLISGRFDLSLESTVAFAPMLAAWVTASVAENGKGLVDSGAVGVVIVLGIGLLVGLFNGLLIVGLKLNPFMVTLAMLIALRGLTYSLTNGATISTPPTPIVFIGQEVILDVPLQIYLVIGLFIMGGLLMRHHRLGRALYAIGGNEEAARAAGVRVKLSVIQAYVIASLLASVAGMMLAGQVDAVTTEQGSGLIFTVFAAAVIGGISLNGGRGAIMSAGLGVLFLSIIGNVMTLIQVPSQVVDAVRGSVILIALIVNRLTFERSDN